VSLWAESAAKAAQHNAKRAHTLHWLLHLGLPGLFAVAIVDSSPIPLPLPGCTDLLLLWLASHKSGNPTWLALCAICGALTGGYLGWHMGRKGGEAALKNRVPARRLDQLHHWAKNNPLLAIFLPALLPPPVPLSPFVFAAGALGVPLNRFLTAFGLARAIRYSLVAWLGATYGRHVIRMWSDTLDKWSIPLLLVFVSIMVIGIILTVIKARRHRNSAAPDHSTHESAAD
jgi:membrane protein YqaA with SNARE-associated domain